MAKALKLKKYPRRPKRTASVATLERYVQKCSMIDKENAERIKAHADHGRRRASALTKIDALPGQFQRVRQRADKAKAQASQIGFRRQG